MLHLQDDGYSCHPQLLQASSQLPWEEPGTASSSSIMTGMDAYCQSTAHGQARSDRPATIWAVTFAPVSEAAIAGNIGRGPGTSAVLVQAGTTTHMHGLMSKPLTKAMGAGILSPEIQSEQATAAETRRLNSEEVVYHTEWRAASPSDAVPGGTT